VLNVLDAMEPLSPDNDFWQWHTLPSDTKEFERKVSEAALSVYSRQTDAPVAAARLELVTGQAFGHVRASDIEQFEPESRYAYGFTLPQDWNGAVEAQSLRAKEVDGKLVAPETPGEGAEAEFWGISAQRRDGSYAWLTPRATEQEANKLAERLAVVNAHSTISEQAEVAKLPRIHETLARLSLYDLARLPGLYDHLKASLDAGTPRASLPAKSV
jgi:hypothetical protein